MSELIRAAGACAPLVHSSFVHRRSLARSSRGFTILELLLALAIVALIGTVLIGGSAQLLSDKPTSADDIFWKAVQQARKTALKTGNEVRLTFVDDRDKGKSFVVNDGTNPQEFPLPPATTSDLAVTFLVAQKGGSAVLVGGTLVETQTIPFVAFYADGTCTAFRAQFQRANGVHSLAIDPWTCAQVLTPPDPNAPL
jgi:general secretion pathway protein H